MAFVPFVLGLATVTTIETAKGIGRGINGTFWATCDGIKEGAKLGYHPLQKSAWKTFDTELRKSSNPVKGAIFLTMAFVPFLLGLATITTIETAKGIGRGINGTFWATCDGIKEGAKLGYHPLQKSAWKTFDTELRKSSNPV